MSNKILAQSFLAIVTMGTLFAESLNAPPPNIFTLSGTFKITDIIVENTTYAEGYDPVAMRFRATIVASTRTTGGGAVTATTNQSAVVTGSFNNKVDIKGGLSDFTNSVPHLIQKDQTIPITFNAPFILSIWASDAPGTATATASIENPIAPPTYQLQNNISTGDPKTTQIGPSLP